MTSFPEDGSNQKESELRLGNMGTKYAAELTGYLRYENKTN